MEMDLVKGGKKKKKQKDEPSQAPEQVYESHDKATGKHLNPWKELRSVKPESFPPTSHLS